MVEPVRSIADVRARVTQTLLENAKLGRPFAAPNLVRFQWSRPTRLLLNRTRRLGSCQGCRSVRRCAFTVGLQVLFEEMLTSLLKVTRIVSAPTGNALLIGASGAPLICRRTLPLRCPCNLIAAARMLVTCVGMLRCGANRV
jgi:hypothetical protein